MTKWWLDLKFWEIVIHTIWPRPILKNNENESQIIKHGEWR